MNAIPYDSPQEDWDRYEDDDTDQPLPGRPRRQFFNRASAALIVLIVGAACFYGGVRVEKSQVSGSSSTSALSSAAGASSRAGATGAGARAGAAGAGSGSGAAAQFGGRSFSGAGAALGGGGSASFGTVSNIKGDTFYVTESSGNTIKVTLSSATKVTKSVTVGKSAVRPGDTVIIRGLSSNGTLNATSISDSGAGSGFGAGSSSSGSSGSGSSGSASSAVNSLFGSGSGG